MHVPLSADSFRWGSGSWSRGGPAVDRDHRQRKIHEFLFAELTTNTFVGFIRHIVVCYERDRVGPFERGAQLGNTIPHKGRNGCYVGAESFDPRGLIFSIEPLGITYPHCQYSPREIMMKICSPRNGPSFAPGHLTRRASYACKCEYARRNKGIGTP